MKKQKAEIPHQQPFPSMKSPKESFKNIRNYLAGQFVGATRDDILLNEVIKCLFCKLYAEKTENRHSFLFSEDIIENAKHVRTIFSKVRTEYKEIFEKDSEILLDPESIHFVMSECAFNLLNNDSDPIGDAFEVFMGNDSRGSIGQFFTPRSVTDLLVKAIDPKPGEKIIDPACGAGGFLASVINHFIRQNVKPEEIKSLATKQMFGVDKDDSLAKLAKVHLSLLTGGHPNILFGDSLAFQFDGKYIQADLEDSFDVLLTNPPFGNKIIAAKQEILKKLNLGYKWKLNKESQSWQKTQEIQKNVPPQVLFVERCISLLKPGGRLGMVLPESLLSNKSYRYVVDYLTTHMAIEAVLGMPEALFKTSGKGGTHTKTCLLICQKSPQKRRKYIFMAEAKWCGQDSRAKIINKNDLPQILENYFAASKGKSFSQSQLGFLTEGNQIFENVLCPRYYDPQIKEEIEALKKNHHLFCFGDLVRDGTLSISTGDELGKMAYGTGSIPFIRTSDISNWEVKADPKHCIEEDIYNRLRAKQDVKINDILFVRDGTYLIGSSAIISELDEKIIYQSHIYKIRVNKNKIGLDPFLLLAVLSSQIVQKQIRSKQFTQDIIDSLGDRIKELILPIPKDETIKEKISSLVKNSVDQRIEAKKAVKKALIAIAC